MSTPAPNDPPPPERRTPFEWSLAALRPADADVARPSFMFKAGQASRQKAVWFWRCVAGGLGVVLAVGGLAGFGLIQSERQQPAAVYEVREATNATPVVITLPTSPSAVAPLAVSTRPVAPVAEPPSPAQVAAALERRRNILVGGLGLIPDAPPVVRPDSPTTPTYPGVFAAPRVEKSPPANDPESDDPR